MKYLIIWIILLILIILFTLKVRVRFFRHYHDKVNIDLTLSFISKYTIDIDEKFNSYISNKPTTRIIKDVIDYLNIVSDNYETIEKLMNKTTVRKIIIIPVYVPSDPIDYSYVQFVNIMSLNLIKSFVNSNFKKVIKEDYHLAFALQDTKKDFLVFDIELRISLFNFLYLFLSKYQVIKNITKEKTIYGKST